MKKLLLSIFAMLVCAYTYAQEENVKRLAPDFASPNIYSFMSYEDISVGKYTGVPNISIPVYNLIDGAVNIPITLRYHASGIKVEQEASWVGLGWNLNVGGHITRRTYGRVDENAYDTEAVTPGPLGLNYLSKNQPYRYPPFVSQGTYISHHNNKFDDIFSTAFEPWLDDEMLGYPYNSNAATNALKRGIAATRGYYQPDIYSFTFPNHSGKFYIKHDENGKIEVINEQSPLQIERITDPVNNTGTVNLGSSIDHPNTTVAWKITDAYGMIYEFNEDNEVYNSGAYWKDKHTSTTFSLSKITYPTGEEVDFIYQEKPEITGESYYTEIAYHMPTKISGTSLNLYNLFPTTASSGTDIGTVKHRISNLAQATNYKPKYLHKIVSSNIVIEFNRNNRQDTSTSGEELLESISVYDKNDLINPVKTFQFNYDYFQNDFSYNTNITDSRLGFKTSSNTAHSYRLKLESFQEDSKPPYSFSYNETYNLPPKRTTAKDYWGFFNGKANYTNIPNPIEFQSVLDPNINLYLFGSSDPNYQPGQFSYPLSSPHSDAALCQYDIITNSNLISADRTPDPNFISTGSLEKVFYPTGGYTEYKYETNTYGTSSKLGPGQRIKSIKKYNDVNSSSPVLAREYEYEFNGESSGKLMSELNFVQHKSNFMTYESGSYGDFKNIEIRANSATAISDAAQGLPIGYSKVQERIIGDNESYTSVETFFNETNADGGHPDLIPEVPFLENGNLLKRELFDKDYSLVQKSTFDYSNINDQNYYGLWGEDVVYFDLVFCTWCGSEMYSSVPVIVLFPYNIPSESYKLTEQIDSTYFYNNSTLETLTNTMIFSYDDKGQLSTSLTTGSNGDVIKTEYKYATLVLATVALNPYKSSRSSHFLYPYD